MSEHSGERDAAMPMTEALDLFDRFWNAMCREGDWTAAFPDWPNGCDCGNCRVCGIRHALSWTAALLSNPALADRAEAKAAERPTPPTEARP